MPYAYATQCRCEHGTMPWTCTPCLHACPGSDSRSYRRRCPCIVPTACLCLSVQAEAFQISRMTHMLQLHPPGHEPQLARQQNYCARFHTTGSALNLNPSRAEGGAKMVSMRRKRDRYPSTIPVRSGTACSRCSCTVSSLAALPSRAPLPPTAAAACRASKRLDRNVHPYARPCVFGCTPAGLSWSPAVTRTC